jgi:hypothetical protein
MVGMDRHGVIAAVRYAPRANCISINGSIHMTGNSSEANLFDFELSNPLSVLLIIQRGSLESFAKGVLKVKLNLRSFCY